MRSYQLLRGLRHAARGAPRFVSTASEGENPVNAKTLRQLFFGGVFGFFAYDYLSDLGTTPKVYAKLVDGLMPVVRLLDPEQAHTFAIKFAALGLTPVDRSSENPILATNVMGLDWPNAVGLAAGFDKHAEAIDPLIDSGFGFVEIGSVTPEPQPGNPKPRMFRLVEDQGVINRCGFNSDGLQVVKERLQKRQANPGNSRAGLLGVNVGKNKWVEEANAIQDYVKGIKELGPYADYLVVNISSPNTPGLRALQRRETIQQLIREAMKARDEVKASSTRALPLLVKIAPDLDTTQKEDIAKVALATKLDGLIVSNTTISRPESLKSQHKTEAGGLSGAPVRELATQTISDMYALTKGQVPIIGVGGIGTGKDAYDKILAGASMVQIYSMMVYDGPGCVRRVKVELASLLKKNGYKNVRQAVGANHAKK